MGRKPQSSGQAPASAAKAKEAPEEEYEYEEPQVIKTQVTGSLRQKLYEEASAFGDTDRPMTAGFGNPYLLGIVVVLVLGVASYYSLDLDKATTRAKSMSEKEITQRMIQTQS